MSKNLCRIVVWGLAALYALALIVYVAGLSGWFGSEPDALSGVYLVILGLPWSRLVDILPEQSWPLALALAPAINVLILAALCRYLGNRRRPAD